MTVSDIRAAVMLSGGPTKLTSLAGPAFRSVRASVRALDEQVGSVVLHLDAETGSGQKYAYAHVFSGIQLMSTTVSVLLPVCKALTDGINALRAEVGLEPITGLA